MWGALQHVRFVPIAMRSDLVCSRPMNSSPKSQNHWLQVDNSGVCDKNILCDKCVVRTSHLLVADENVNINIT